jgi:hypothetical protein
VYVDVDTDEPMFGTVKEGLFSRHLTFVPLKGITIGPDDLQMRVPKEQVEAAPNHEMEGEELSQADESALYHHYYTPPEAGAGSPAIAHPPKESSSATWRPTHAQVAWHSRNYCHYAAAQAATRRACRSTNETSEDDRLEVGGAVKVNRDRHRSQLAPGSFEGFCMWLLG